MNATSTKTVPLIRSDSAGPLGAIRGYDHADELGSAMREASGNRHDLVEDPMRLNMVEALDELHKQLEATH